LKDVGDDSKQDDDADEQSYGFECLTCLWIHRLDLHSQIINLLTFGADYTDAREQQRQPARLDAEEIVGAMVQDASVCMTASTQHLHRAIRIFPGLLKSRGVGTFPTIHKSHLTTVILQAETLCLFSLLGR
jgi:hypothetical protein